MDAFLFDLDHVLELQNFGVTYEDLVPVTCFLGWTSENQLNEFARNIAKYLMPQSDESKHYIVLEYKIKKIVRLYWKDIISENLEFKKIKL